ncbi:hypothetical protein BBFL7_02152 [Flavobacteria bacterium BBFL7]|nr:hypothetical protein BBFL7_02152 [Flavobacteria bacterium BBFL7]
MKKIIYIILCIATITIQSCGDKSTLNADQIIDKAIYAHGGHLLEQSTMVFNFRDVRYRAIRNNGEYEFTRIFKNDSSTVVDMFSNYKSMRLINDIPQRVADSVMNGYVSGVNSVIYFAQLPYSLDGPAVYRELIGEKIINNQPYYKVKITFDPNGGGEDHEDEFIYWIQKETYLVDYLAYSYCEEECGYRFRESINRRNINGVMIQDYNNYKETIQDPDLSHMDQLFLDQKLDLLSKIILENVTIDIKD